MVSKLGGKGLCSLLQPQFVLNADEAGVYSKEDEAFGHLEQPPS